jgi:hypothetical protein
VWSSAYGRVGVHLFEGALTLADMSRMEMIGEAWRRRNPAKTSELSIIYPSEARMTNEERMRLAQVIKRGESYRNAAATVILAEGMLGALQRSLLTGLILVAYPQHPAKVFATVHEAVGWLLPHALKLEGPRITSAELLAAISELCAEFQARSESPSLASPR